MLELKTSRRYCARTRRLLTPELGTRPAPPAARSGTRTVRPVKRSRMRLLGIDVGTGGTRAVVVDERGGVVASATAEHAPFASPRTGWAEQDPRDWWRATARAVRELSERHSVAGDE